MFASLGAHKSYLMTVKFKRSPPVSPASNAYSIDDPMHIALHSDHKREIHDAIARVFNYMYLITIVILTLEIAVTLTT